MTRLQRHQMHGYQQMLVDWMADHPFGFCMVDLGLGKTISSLTLVERLVSNFEADRVLVIGPLRVALDTWPTEIQNWQHISWLTHTQLAGLSEPERNIAAKQRTKIHIINREMVDWLVQFHGPKWPYRVVIVDECFVAGTSVTTPDGQVPIEELRVGDSVVTPYGAQSIKAVLRKKSHALVRLILDDGSTIRCTPDHRFLTADGWVKASNLEGHCLYGQQDIASEELRPLRERVLDPDTQEDLLRTLMLKQSKVGWRDLGSCSGDSEKSISFPERLRSGAQGPTTFGGSEGEAPGQGQQERIQRHPWRQWGWHDQARVDVGAASGLGLGSQLRDSDWYGQGLRISDGLQGGLCVARQDDCTRSGRVKPQHLEAPITGSEEGRTSLGSRVVGVSREEHPSGVDVYDLSVDGAPFYFAEGRLVHNCDSFKNHQSERFKALAKVRHTPGLIDRLYLLTATPAAESYIGLWAQVYLLDLGKRLGKNITRYRDMYFTQNKYTYTYKIRPGAEEAILDKIKDISIVMKSEDYLPRDKPTMVKTSVTLDEKTYDIIKHLQKHFIMTLPDGTELEAKTAAALASMVLQMASGTVYETLLVEDVDTDDLKKIKKVHHIHGHKIEALKEIAEQAKVQGSPLLVAYWFKSSLANLRKAFPKAVVMGEHPDTVKRWNAGKIDMLLIHPASAGHGLNLQYGGNHLVFFDLLYSLGLYLQTVGRLDRQGQTKPVIVQHLVAKGTRDELVYELLAHKADAQEKLFRILKRLIEKYRKAKTDTTGQV